jgi:hypothetical protein
MVPQAPMTLLETDPGLRKAYATGMSRITLTESIIKAFSWACFSLSLYIIFYLPVHCR